LNTTARLRVFTVRRHPMAAIIALALCFGVFALLNLIDTKRLD
jgi:hypothetical protein